MQQVNFTNWIASGKFDIPSDVQKDVWQKQNIISNCFALPIVFLVGRLSDRMSPKLLVPGVLIFQIVLMGGYMLCGAAIFQIIESDSRVGLAARAIEAGNKQI